MKFLVPFIFVITTAFVFIKEEKVSQEPTIEGEWLGMHTSSYYKQIGKSSDTQPFGPLLIKEEKGKYVSEFKRTSFKCYQTTFEAGDLRIKIERVGGNIYEGTYNEEKDQFEGVLIHHGLRDPLILKRNATGN